jgi:thioredoxin-related protein
MRRLMCLSILSLLSAAVFGLAQEQPSKASKGKAEPPPFSEKADAKAELQKALQRAKKNNRRVLIFWGEDSSESCALLHKTLTTDAGLRRKRLYEYESINIAVGPATKNGDLAKQYQAAVGGGIPMLTLLDSDGKVLQNQGTALFEIKSAGGQKEFDKNKLLEFLTKHEAKPLVAAKVLQNGLDEAAKTDRLVFLHFGAPWCGWCHRLEDWMETPEIAKILNKEFVDVQIDIDRMDGGKAILERYNVSGKGGIPWFAFLDAKGKALVNSDSPKGNIGHPYQAHEIDHFVKMLSTTRRHLSQADIDRIDQSLKAQKKLQ